MLTTYTSNIPTNIIIKVMNNELDLIKLILTKLEENPYMKGDYSKKDEDLSKTYGCIVKSFAEVFNSIKNDLVDCEDGDLEAKNKLSKRADSLYTSFYNVIKDVIKSRDLDCI